MRDCGIIPFELYGGTTKMGGDALGQLTQARGTLQVVVIIDDKLAWLFTEVARLATAVRHRRREPPVCRREQQAGAHLPAPGLVGRRRPHLDRHPGAQPLRLALGADDRPRPERVGLSSLRGLRATLPDPRRHVSEHRPGLSRTSPNSTTRFDGSRPLCGVRTSLGPTPGKEVRCGPSHCPPRPREPTANWPRSGSSTSRSPST